MRYVDWVDRVLKALDHGVTGDGNASLIGVGLQQLHQDLAIALDAQAEDAIWAAVNDLEMMNCAEGEVRRVKVTQNGQKIARAGGLQRGWESLFERYVPLDEDRLVLVKVVELGVLESDTHASTQLVEMKEALREVGGPLDQGTAIAVTKRLQAIGCLHQDAVITAGGQDGRCLVRPSYVGIVIATEQRSTEVRALIESLVSGWETTSVDMKESLQLASDRQKAEFCKDVLALANTLVSGRRFLVLGFNDTSRVFTTSVDPTVDAHKMESVLAAYCRPVPEIQYTTVELKGGSAGLVEVHSQRSSLAYKLVRDIWKLKADSVFVRHNTLVELATGAELTSLVAEGERARV